MTRSTLRATFVPGLTALAVLVALATAAVADDTVDLQPAMTPGAASMGAVDAGVYRLPPGIGGVTVTVTAFGSVPSDAGLTQNKYLYVKLSIANDGDQPFTLLPSACTTLDDRGNRIAGANLFSGQTRLTTATLAPGARDELDLGFPLAAEADFAALRTITVHWAYTYAGRQYTAIVPLTSSGASSAAMPTAPSATAGAAQHVYVLPGVASTQAASYVQPTYAQPQVVVVTQPAAPEQPFFGAYGYPTGFGLSGLFYNTVPPFTGYNTYRGRHEGNGSWRHHGSDWTSGPVYAPTVGGNPFSSGLPGYALGWNSFIVTPAGYGGGAPYTTSFTQAAAGGPASLGMQTPAAATTVKPVTLAQAPRASAAPASTSPWKSLGLTSPYSSVTLPTAGQRSSYMAPPDLSTAPTVASASPWKSIGLAPTYSSSDLPSAATRAPATVGSVISSGGAAASPRAAATVRSTPAPARSAAPAAPRPAAAAPRTPGGTTPRGHAASQLP
jgi:hypothetical protein